MVWYGVVVPSRKLIFFEGGGGCFFQMMSDFFGFFPWVTNHAPSPLLDNLHTPRHPTSHDPSPRPCFLVRASPRITESTSTRDYSSIASTTHAHTRKRSSLKKGIIP
jgi:hypothetical protein